MDFGDINQDVLLKELDKAILTVANGAQEFRIGKHYVKRADLAALYKMKTDLETQANSTDDWNSNTYSAVFEGR